MIETQQDSQEVITSGPFIDGAGLEFVRQYIIRPSLDFFEGGVLIEDVQVDAEQS